MKSLIGVFLFVVLAVLATFAYCSIAPAIPARVSYLQ